MTTNAELRGFLRSRRARLTPEQAGVQSHGGARRVPGLRREEVAHLAGVSADYYGRLEQGRPINTSQGVLDAVARALQLDAVERAHLLQLVRAPSGEPPAPPTRPEAVRPDLQRLMGTLDHTPAYITGRRMEVLAMNHLARTLLADLPALPPGRRSLARFVFLDPVARERLADWEPLAVAVTSMLRRWVGLHPEDALLTALVEDLLVDGDFAFWWAQYAISCPPLGDQRLRHPSVGELVLDCQTFYPADEAEQCITVYTAQPGSPAELSLAALGGPDPAASEAGRRAPGADPGGRLDTVDARGARAPRTSRTG